MHTTRATHAWILFDGAQSAFSAVILTFVYATFFTKSIAPDPTLGAAWWGYAIALSGFIMAILAPILGTLADHTGQHKKPMLASFTLCAVMVSMMWFTPPQAPLWLIIFTLGLLVVANISMELSQIFYNALLRRIADKNNLGPLSSFGWGVGYAGGLIALLCVLFGFIGLGDIKPLIAFSRENDEHIRIATIFVSLWMLILAIPAFLYLPRDEVTSSDIKIIPRLKTMLQHVWSDKNRLRFLIASAVYRDGLNTVFAVGGIYAATRFDLQTSAILLLGILLNVTAGLGCAVAVWAEKRFSSLNIIQTSLILLIGGFVLILLAPSQTMFFIAASFCGLFIGPIQASSRAYMASISPATEQAGQFGLYALTGKALAFFGPLLFAFVTNMTGQVTFGFATCLIFFIVGYILLRPLQKTSRSVT